MASKNKNRKGNSQPLEAKLVVMPIRRNSSDIATWRTALRSADNGRRKALYELYEDLLIDGILADAVDNKRIGAILNAEIAFQADGKEVPEITDLMDTPEFEDLLREILLTKFWGKTVIECDFTDGFSVASLPRTHLRPKYKEVAIKDADERGISYAGNDMVMDLGKDTDLGLFLKAAPYVIYKRGGFGDWAQWVELFGMPHRIGKYNAYDPQSRELLIKAFSEAGSKPDIVAPKETEIEIKNTGAGSNGASFNEFRNACNEELLITVVGNTMTTLQGSSRAQGEVHLETQQSISKADRRYVQRVLNRLFLPILEKRGYPVGCGTFYFPEAGETLTTLQRLDKDIKTLEVVPISRKHFYETYDVPRPEKGEELAGEWGKVQPVAAPPQPAQLSDTTPPSPPSGDFGGIFTRLINFFVGASQGGAAYHNGAPLILSDDAETNALLNRVASGESKIFDPELFMHESAKLIEAFRHGWNSRAHKLAEMGFEYGHITDAYKTAMELNLFHFSAAKNIAEIQALNQLYRESRNFAEFAKKAEALVDNFNKAWAKTEYDTAYKVAENSALYWRLKKQQDIFPYWQYKTVDDGRVREEHYKLHDLILPQNDKCWNEIFPPNGWNCRCYVVPLTKAQALALEYSTEAAKSTIDEYKKSAAYKRQAAQRWNTNRAKMEKVFGENQLYIRRFPQQAHKYLEDINYHIYKLGSLSDNQKKAQNPMPVYEGTREDFFAKLDKVPNNAKLALLTDYNGRRVILEEDNFLDHTKPKNRYAVRPQMLAAMEETLRSPDEVWVNGYKGKIFDNFLMVKHYKDMTMCVVGKVEKGSVYQVKTWFDIKAQTPKYKYRHGLLVYKK